MPDIFYLSSHPVFFNWMGYAKRATAIIAWVMLVMGVWSCNGGSEIPHRGAEQFELGVMAVDITPPIGYNMYGYPPVKSTGIKDSLYAKALVFKQGDTKGALLICNLLGIPRDLSRVVREEVSKETGIPFQNITVSATHTHTAPGITREFQNYIEKRESGSSSDSEVEHYFEFLIRGMVKAVTAAYGNRRPVRIKSGIGQAEGVSFNRRYLMTDGKVRFNPGRLNQKIVSPAGPVDPDVHVILFQVDDHPTYNASLSVFSSHYVRGGTEFSADYPYFIEKELKSTFGNEFVSVFGLGACGDVNTVDVTGAKVESSDEKVESMGNTLAEIVKGIAQNSKINIPDFEVLSKVIYLPLQDYSEEELEWSKSGPPGFYSERPFLEQRRRLKISEWGVQPPLEQLRLREAIPPSVSGEPWRLPVEIHVFKFDSETAIVTMPGELFVELGIELKRQSPFNNTMLIELANADIAYVPTARAFEEGDYEAINSRLAPGSGEKMVEVAVEMLNELFREDQ